MGVNKLFLIKTAMGMLKLKQLNVGMMYVTDTRAVIGANIKII